MDITYTYRTRADGSTYQHPCEGLWQALNMAEYHVKQQADEVEPVAISISQSSSPRTQRSHLA